MTRLNRGFALLMTTLVVFSGIMASVPATASVAPTAPFVDSVTTLNDEADPSPSTEAAEARPTPEVTPEPTAEPTPEPTERPTPEVTPEPTAEPTPEPTERPTPEATPEPTQVPAAEPSALASSQPDPDQSPEATPDATSEPETSPIPDPSASASPDLAPDASPPASASQSPEASDAASPVASVEPTLEPTPTPAPNPSSEPGTELPCASPVVGGDAAASLDPGASEPAASRLPGVDPCAPAADRGFGISPFGLGSQISGFVWLDVNANGVYEPGDPVEGAGSDAPLAGVTVGLYPVGGSVPVLVTTTDVDGTYVFADLADGDYAVVFVAPLGFRGTTTSPDSPAVPDAPPTLPLQNATSRIDGLTITGAAILEANDAGIRPSPELGLAFAQKPGGGDALFDGTGPFDADDTAGHDSSSGNLRVRTADITTYDFSITADNFALGQTTIDNVILEQVIIPNDGASIEFAVEGPTYLPTSCKTSGVSPASFIEPAGPPDYPAGSWRLVCNIGTYEEGEVRIVDTNVRALTNSPNESSFSTLQRVYQATDAAVPATLAAPDIIITAAPRYDLTKGTGGEVPNPLNRQGIGDGYRFYRFPDGSTRIAREVWYDLSLVAANRGLGQEALESPLSFQDTLGLEGPGGPIAFGDSFVSSCGPGPIGGSLPLAGDGPPYASNRVADSGDWDCDFDPSTGTTDITVTGADTTGTHYPSQGASGNSLGDLAFVTTGHIRIIVPLDVWATAVDPSWQPNDPLPGGDVIVTNCVADFAPVSVSGVPNFPDIGGEPTDNNCHVLVADVDAAGSAGSQKSFGDFPAYRTGGGGIQSSGTIPGASGSRTGDAPVGPGQQVAGRITFGTGTYEPVRDVLACDAFDNATLRLAALYGGAATQSPAPISSYANILEYDDETGAWSVGTAADWVVEFAAAGDWGYDHLAGPRDPISGYYPLSSGWSTQRAAASAACTDTSLSWSTDPTAVAGGINAVNVIRIRTVDPDRGFRLGDQVILGTAFDVRDVFLGGPNDGSPVPDGTKLPNFGLFQWDGHGQTSSYDPNTATGDQGDRLIMSRAQVRLVKDAPFTTAEAGDPIVWTLRPSVVDGTVDGYATDVTVTDVLPEGVTFDQDCTEAALPSGITLGSVDYDTPVVGLTTIRFELGDREGGVAIAPISVCTETDPFFPPNYDVINTATVASPNAPSPLALRRDTATVRLLQQASFNIAKRVDQRVDLQDDDQVWSIRWANFSTSLPFADIDVIEVFPFNGDGDPDAGAPRNNVASDFQGTLTIGGPLDQPIRQPLERAAEPDPGIWYYATATDPKTLSYDPRVAANLNPEAPGGLWCTAAEIGSGGACPIDYAAVRAVRFVEGADLPAGDYVTATVPLQTLGNRPGDIYVDRVAAGSSTTPNQILRSNQPFVQVLGFSLGDLVFSDIDRNGRYDDGIDAPVPGVTVQVEDEFGTLVATTVTDADGRWVVEHLDPGVGLDDVFSARYRVVIPASQFQAGGPLLGYWAAPNPTNPDLDRNEPVDHHARDLGEPSTLGSSSALVTLSADASGAVIRGQEPLGDNVADLGNPLMGDSFTQLTVDMGFEPLPVLDMVKSITSGPTSLANGNVRIAYRIRVTNTGPGAGTYDIVDQLRFGTGVTIVSANADTNAAWNGVSVTQLADDAVIGGNATVDHTITVEVHVDPATATYTSTDCTLAGGETGTGLRNDASFAWTDGHHGPQADDDDVCAPLPILRLDKTIVGSPVLNGNGTTTITYDVTVRNAGGGDGLYDLDDRLRFGTGVTIGTGANRPTVTNTAPGTIATLASWNGAANVRVVTGQNIAAQTGASAVVHVYRVVAIVSINASTATNAASDCTLAGGETGTGFRNDATLTNGQEALTDNDCAPFASIRVLKALVGTPTQNGNGTVTITYDLTVQSRGAVGGSYTLTDRFRFGTGVTIVAPAATVTNTVPGTITTIAGWDGVTNQAIVTSQPIAAQVGATATQHVYRVSVTVSIDATTATFPSSDCTLAGGETGTGFRNDGGLVVNGTSTSANACAAFPIIRMAKTLTSSIVGNDGLYTVTYGLNVTNTGAGAGSYSLTDQLRFGTGVSIVAGTAAVTNTVPGTITPMASWTGVAPNTTIVTNQAIAAGTSAAATPHTYRVSVRVGVDPATATTASTDCSLTGGETGTGARNDASMTTNGVTTTGTACADFPILSTTKTIVGAPTENGDGTTTIRYDLTVSNRGGGAGTYDLDDALQFGAGVTIVAATVSNTTPGSITTRPQWNGVSDQRVVTAQVIVAQTVASPVQHVYRVTAVVTIDGSATTPDSADCILTGGETGTGFRNVGRMTHGTTTTVTDCAPFPAVAVVKTIAAGPVDNGDGTTTIDYDLTVTSTGAVATSYSLSDTLRFGTGATVVPGTASVSNTSPATITTNPLWDGVSVTSVVTGESIGIGVVHVYHVTATATTDPATTTTASSDCTLSGGETGTGFRNDGTLAVNGGQTTSTACAPFPAIRIAKTVNEVLLGTDGVHDLTYDIVVSNVGSGAGAYTLTDTLRFGTGATIVPASAHVSNTTPGGIVTNPAWDGVTTTNVVTGQSIGAVASHVYRVTVRVIVDPATGTLASSDCTVTGGEAGTGFRNDTSLSSNGVTAEATDCAPFALLTIAKTVVGNPTENGDGTWTIAYDLGVANAGAGAARYDLSDTLEFGTGVAVQTAGVTTSSPGAGAPNPAWNGSGQTSVVTGVSLPAATSHVYRVTVTAGIDEQAATAPSSDCTLTGGETGTGFRNTGRVTWGDHRLRTAGSLQPVGGPVTGPTGDTNACAPFPILSLTKTLVGTPVENGNGSLTVAYDVTVRNTGAGPSSYDLVDAFAFGTGVSIVAGSASVTNTDPTGITTDPLWDGVIQTTVVTGQPIAGTTSHVYRVTVSVTVDESATDPGSSDCILASTESGTGLRNETALTTNGEQLDADACAPVPAVVVSKSVTSVILGTDGLFTISYRLSIANNGSAVTTYSLSDAFAFGAGSTIVPGSASVTPAGGSPTPIAGWTGVTPNTAIVTGASIAAGATHSFTVVVRVSVDPGIATNASSDCTLGTGETGTGFWNAASLTVNGESAPVIACTPFPILVIDKVVVGAPVENGDGSWTIAYDLTVANSGAADARYDLSDTLHFGAGVTVLTAGVTTSSPGAGTPSASWDGTSDTSVVTGVTLAASTGHVYRVTVTAAIDESVATAASSDCALTGTETGTGFRNDARVTWDDRRDTSGGPLAPIGGDVSGPTGDADACAPFPILSLAKDLVGDPVENGDGTTTIDYDLTVTNTGAGAGVYDLTDTLRFGTGVTILSAGVSNTTPGSIVTNTTWDGVSDTVVVTDEVIAGSTAHVDRVTVTVTTDPDTATTASSDCTLDTSETGTGFRNDTRLVTNGETLDADACAPFAIVTLLKDLVGTPAYDGLGGATIEYDLTVINTGAGATTYDLTDELRFGIGATVLHASVANTSPMGITTNPLWDGLTDLTVVSGLPMPATTTHVYRVTVTATVDSATATTNSSDCTLGQGETGTGWLNEAGLSVNGVDTGSTDCAPFPILQVTKTVTEGPTAQGDGALRIAYAVTVSNSGTADGAYDLDDALRFGAGVTVVSSAVANTTPGAIVTNPGWNGLTDTRVVTGVVIEPATEHAYSVTAVVTTDPATSTTTSSDCTMGPGETGTGLRNEAAMTESGVPVSVDACAPFPILIVAKTIVGAPVSDSLGNVAVEYDVTVSNSGAADGVYDLSDTLRFGADVTILTAAVVSTVPGTIATNVGWDGVTDTLVVAGEPIAAGATHIYRVSVTALVGIHARDTDADCILDPGESGTGLSNTATLGDNGVDTDADACGVFALPDPIVRIDKAVIQSPTANAQRLYTVLYSITVSNDGRATTYDLSDQLRYGAGVEVRSASVRSIDPTGIPTEPDWDGSDQQLIAAGVPIAIAGIHVYEVTVTVAIHGGDRTQSSSDCDLDAGESGTGLRNDATLVVEGGILATTDDACVSITDLPATDTLSLLTADSGGQDPMSILALVLAALLGAGAYWFVWRPRRREIGADPT